MGDGLLTAQDLKFVHWFRKYRDFYRAAEKANLARRLAKRTFERPEIRDEIERQDLVVEQERARVQVQAEGITKDLLDAELSSLIKLSPKTHSAVKLKAIEVGYIRAGVLQGTLKAIDLTPPSPDDEVAPPTVYQAFIPVGVPVQGAPIMPAGSSAAQPSVPAMALAPATSAPKPAAASTPAQAQRPAYPRAGRIGS